MPGDRPVTAPMTADRGRLVVPPVLASAQVAASWATAPAGATAEELRAMDGIGRVWGRGA